MSEIPINPEVEFDPVPLESIAGVFLIRDIEDYLRELSGPAESTWKNIGGAVLSGLTMRMGLYRPFPHRHQQ